MIDLQTVSIAIASASVVAGVVYYALQIRHQTRIRKTDVIMRLHSESTRKEMVDAQIDFYTLQFKDYSDLQRKYGFPTSKSPETTAILMTGMFYEGIGVLVHRGLADIDLVRELFAVDRLWRKMMPIAEGMRKQFGRSSAWEWFEYLADEVQKREQKNRAFSVT
jgi:hypothetical protein